MQKRQKALLESIVEVNLNKEILAAKMHIHDELGHCLLATTKAITEDRLAENADTLRKSWNSTIQDFSNISTCLLYTSYYEVALIGFYLICAKRRNF